MINGHIVRGVGVVFSADVFGQIFECLRRQVLVTLEHHVLEQMGETAAPIGSSFDPT